MRVSEARNLRLMRDAQDLVGLRERLQFQPDGLGDAPANASVNFVEDNRARKSRGARTRLEHEHEARGLAARSDLRERPKWFAGVRGEVELDAVEARRGELSRGLARV